jgi:hypothetical protein
VVIGISWPMCIKQVMKPLLFNAVFSSNFNYQLIFVSVIYSQVIVLCVFFTKRLFTSICHQIFYSDGLRCFDNTITQNSYTVYNNFHFRQYYIITYTLWISTGIRFTNSSICVITNMLLHYNCPKTLFIYSPLDESLSLIPPRCFFKVHVSFQLVPSNEALFLEPRGRPLFRSVRLANRSLFSSTDRQVRLLWPSAMPHLWHFVFFFLTPFAPNLITLFSVPLIVLPFGFALSGLLKLTPLTLKSSFYIFQIKISQCWNISR